MQKKITILLLSLLLVVKLFAQANCNEKALRISYLQARKNQYLLAINTLTQSLLQHPKCADTWDKLAELYYRTNQLEKAFDAVGQCIKTNENDGMNAMYGLRKVMQSYEENEQANQLLKYVINKISLKEKNRNDLLRLCATYDKQKSMQLNAVVGLPKNLGNHINTSLNQTFPSLTLDANTLVFTSNVNALNEDFMISTYDTCLGWSKAINMGYPPNTGGPERSARISADGYYLFFTRCDNRSENGYDGGGCDIIFCFKENDSTWSSPQKFGATINTPDYEGEPCISSDNKTMYFVSDRAGGYGGKDIWKSKFEKGYWQVPINLGAQINTAGNETSPFIHPDNETFYFISDKHNPIGGSDAYTCKQKGDTTFTASINLGYPINTIENENSITVCADGKFGMIARTEKGEKKQIDIYQFDTYKAIEPKKTHCIKGKIIDKKSKMYLTKFRMHLYDSTMQLLKTFSSNEGDASFAFPILHGHLYYLKVDEDADYLPFTATLDLKNNQLPANIMLPILLKKPYLIDTLYSYKITSILQVDTNIGWMKNEYQHWKKYVTDSISIHTQFTYHCYIDSSFLHQYCISDSGYLDYLKYVDSMLAIQKKTFDGYVNWYKNYYKWIGFSENNIFIKTQTIEATENKLYSIDTQVIEIY
jgi:WD40-like Beta Propeller Repeat